MKASINLTTPVFVTLATSSKPEALQTRTTQLNKEILQVAQMTKMFLGGHYNVMGTPVFKSSPI